MIAFILATLFQAFLAFLIGTLVFDAVHYGFHLCIKSPLLRKLGRPHFFHHRFYSSALQINQQWIKANLNNHVIPEYLIQMAGISCCFFFFHPLAIALAMLVQTYIFIEVCYYRGCDRHHVARKQLPPYRGGFFVSKNYHALHHVYPNSYFSSYIKLLDWILGTGHHLAGKRIAMTGASGALGRNMKRLLEKEGAIVTAFKFGVDYTYDNYESLRDTLAHTDILFLCHGSKLENAQQANCASFVAIIELFKSVHKPTLVPLEIWGVGSEIECHPCFGIKKLKPYASSKRQYAKHARQYFYDKKIQYRHLVHAAFTSRMGPGLMSAKVAAFMTLFFIKRGFKYVPVTYTGFAYLNYLRFVFRW